MGNTLGVSSAWDGQTPINTFTSQPFPEMYTPFTTINSNNKRPLSLDTQDYPQLKRHESEYSFTSPYVTAASSVTGSSWALDTTTPSSFTEIGLSEEAADVCSMWFSKYNMLPRYANPSTRQKALGGLVLPRVFPEEVYNKPVHPFEHISLLLQRC
jgi:hypothetical protein